MIITAKVWDKQSSINGRDAEFLKGHFKKKNGNDDRVLISYDGIISRIEYLDDCFFNHTEKDRMAMLIESGLSREEAIAKVWEEKAQAEENARIAAELNAVDDAEIIE